MHRAKPTIVTLIFVMAVVMGSVYYYATAVEPNSLDVERIQFSWPGVAHPVRIAQLSDIHLRPQVPPEQLHRALLSAQGAQADLLVLTGDFVTDQKFEDYEILQQQFSEIRFPLGAYAVLGNHDEWADPYRVASSLEKAGVVVLENTHRSISLEDGGLLIAGVGDVWENKDDLPLTLGDIPGTQRVLLLAHEPDFADVAAQDQRMGLQLSGHSHGGQVKLPLMPRAIPKHAWKYPEGLRRVGDMWLYVNRGLGLGGPGLRLNCPPELTIIDLIPASDGNDD